MPVPVITQPESPRILAAGVSFELTLSATGSPTNWYATTLPDGLEIDSGGNITGAPDAAGYANVSLVAANGSGNSSAVYLELLTLSAAEGAAADSLARRIDWDLDTGKLTLVGKGDAQPAGYPPVTGENGVLITMKAGDVFPLSIGLKTGGVLVEPTVDSIDVTLKAAEDETGLSIARDAATVRKTGSGTAPRHEARIQLIAAQVATWINDGAIEDARGQAFNGLLELTLTSGSIRRTSQTVAARVYLPLVEVPDPTGAWGAVAALSTGRYSPGGFGTQHAAVCMGGYVSAVSTSCEEFDGAAWSAGGSLSTARAVGGSTGTLSAGLAAGGWTGSAIGSSEEYNGTSWGAGGTLNTARGLGAAAGTQTAGVYFGGSTGSRSAVTETYNGTSWTNSGALSAAKQNPAGLGTQSAALCAGGFTGSASAVSEEFNGSTWSAGGNLLVAKYELWGVGTQSDALVFGGYVGSGSGLATSESYNGTTWASGSAMSSARMRHGGAGASATPLAFAGFYTSDTTEEFYV